MKSRSARSSERGFALFLALLVLLVLTISGIALMFNTSVEQTMSSTETKISKTFYAADSGIEYASAKLRGDNNWKGGQMPVGISANYTAAPTPTDIKITVTAPVYLGSTIRQGDPIATVNEPQIVEKLYSLSSTADSTVIQSTKTITAQVALYPAVRTIEN